MRGAQGRHLQRVARDLAARQRLDAQRRRVLLELRGAVRGERERQDNDQARARQAASLLRGLRHIAQRAQLDERARLPRTRESAGARFRAGARCVHAGAERAGRHRAPPSAAAWHATQERRRGRAEAAGLRCGPAERRRQAGCVGKRAAAEQVNTQRGAAAGPGRVRRTRKKPCARPISTPRSSGDTPVRYAGRLER